MSFYDFASPGSEAVDSMTAGLMQREQLKRQAMLDELNRQNVQSQMADRESNRRIQDENAQSLAADREAQAADRRQKDVAGVIQTLKPEQDITGTSATSILPGFLQRTEGGATLPATQTSDAGTTQTKSVPDASVPTRQIYTGTPQQIGMHNLSKDIETASESGKPLDKDQLTSRLLDLGTPIDKVAPIVDTLMKQKPATKKVYDWGPGGKLVPAGEVESDAIVRNEPREPKSTEPDQNKLEQQYRQILTRTMNSRSGGLGLEDQKVNMAAHLLGVYDQNYDPKTKEYHIPTSVEHEVALGLARLMSPNGQIGAELESKIHQGTAFGEAAKMVSGITGIPVTGNTQAVLHMYLDSIMRQAQIAERNRETYFDQMRAMAPTDLEDSRVERMNEALRKANTVKGLTIRGYNDKANDKAATTSSGGSWFETNAPKGK